VSGWEIAAAALIAALLPCVLVGLRGSARDGLAALELAGTLTATALMVLAQAYGRQPFVDLAIVLAVLSNIGALVYARLLEGEW
jgi:multisubunit Na+/H+ antiporter MnhF subunit